MELLRVTKPPSLSSTQRSDRRKVKSKSVREAGHINAGLEPTKLGSGTSPEKAPFCRRICHRIASQHTGELTTNSISKCPVFGPGHGSSNLSKIDALSGSRTQPNTNPGPLTKGPDLVSFHCLSCSAARVAFLIASDMVSFAVVTHGTDTMGCSDRFWPTDGRSCRGVIPKDSRKLASPIPEFIRI